MGTGHSSNLIACSAADDGALIVASAIEITFDADGAPARRVQLLPMGLIQLRDGRGPYELRDRAHAERVVAATRGYLGSVDFMFDFDHQAVWGAQPGIGGRAEASGWVKPQDLEAADDGIWATVDWTEDADAALRKRKYRYLSPVFRAAADGLVTRLSNAAITNTPAIDLPAIAAATSEGSSMTLKAIAVAAGLAEGATETEIVAAIQASQVTATALGTIAVAAGLTATATAEDIAATVTDFRTNYVPKSVVEPLKEEVQRQRAKRIGDAVDALVAAGVVPPMKRQSTLDWYLKDEVAAAAHYADLPPIVEPGQRAPGEKPKPFTSLTEEEQVAAAAAGLSEAAFLEAKNAEIA